MVLLGERVDHGPADHVVIDNVAAAREITAHLIRLGRRRIAAIGSQRTPEGASARLRLAGYADALTEAGLGYDEALVAPAPAWHRADGAAAMRGLLDSGVRPDAVFCFNDTLALGALRALHEAGLRVPEDVAVAGFDDIEDGRFSIPTLTTVAPDKAQIARLAVELLAERLDGDRAAPARELSAPYRLELRESTQIPLTPPPTPAAPGDQRLAGVFRSPWDRQPHDQRGAGQSKKRARWDLDGAVGVGGRGVRSAKIEAPSQPACSGYQRGVPGGRCRQIPLTVCTSSSRTWVGSATAFTCPHHGLITCSTPPGPQHPVALVDQRQEVDQVLQDVHREEHVHRVVGQRQRPGEVRHRVHSRRREDVQPQVARPLLGGPTAQVDHHRLPAADAHPAPDAQHPGQPAHQVPDQP